MPLLAYIDAAMPLTPPMMPLYAAYAMPYAAAYAAARYAAVDGLLLLMPPLRHEGSRHAASH